MILKESKIAEEIENITNSNKQPINGTVMYGQNQGDKVQHLLPFKSASLSLDDNMKIVKDLADNSPLNVLYSGECSCETKCERTVNILTVGQTGAGKTTWIDSFANYVMGIEIYDKFRYKLVDERGV